jgi:putative transcriptional regulator
VMRGLTDLQAWAKGDLKLTAREARPLPLPKMTAKEVVRVRAQVNASQVAFARILNVSRKTVEAWESGARSPGGPALKLLAVAARHPEVLLEV